MRLIRTDKRGSSDSESETAEDLSDATLLQCKRSIQGLLIFDATYDLSARLQAKKQCCFGGSAALW